MQRHPQSQGQIDRFSQTPTRYLQKHLCDGVFAAGKNWTALLSKVTYEYKVAIHSATNRPPFNLFLSRSGSNVVTCSIDSSIVDSDENHIYIQIRNIEENDNKVIDTTIVNQKYLGPIDRKCVHNLLMA